MAKTNEKVARTVSMNIPSTDLNKGKKEIELIIINGQRIEIAKDEDVEVKPIVRDLYRECNKNLRLGNEQKGNLVIEGI